MPLFGQIYKYDEKHDWFINYEHLLMALQETDNHLVNFTKVTENKLV